MKPFAKVTRRPRILGKRTGTEKYLMLFYLFLVGFNLVFYVATGSLYSLIAAIIIGCLALLIWRLQTKRIEIEHRIEMFELYREAAEKGWYRE